MRDIPKKVTKPCDFVDMEWKEHRQYILSPVDAFAITLKWPQNGAACKNFKFGHQHSEFLAYISNMAIKGAVGKMLEDSDVCLNLWVDVTNCQFKFHINAACIKFGNPGLQRKCQQPQLILGSTNVKERRRRPSITVFSHQGTALLQ